ncbi:substrate-binding domain-containing protein [Roseibium salinum]|uniref:Substrate-binding domain-containing protein n=1 Tax=Roseibium salinum TaxID=1604349 RepID=A0ABT3R4C6_9HYPH|nr:substrate-binding domain-containing protein [Roseibium sp. DSM 29163]MCX2723991.1 substrate-binding domain-containing protein [Roseibium sp. DSM 29163]
MPFAKLRTCASGISRRRRVLALTVLAVLALASPAHAQTSDLTSKKAFRVCADPANLPLSNQAEEGFENEIAGLFAGELGLPLQYTWFPMATGFVRNTLQANRCDVVMGYGQGDEMVLNTNHYYTSSYVLVVPTDGPFAGVDELSDPALKDARIGVIAGSPPASHMVGKGLMAKARPYSLMVDRRYDNPAGDMLEDVKTGTIDAAILWGPIGGPMVKQGYPDLKATPLLAEAGMPRMFYRITMGVRRGEKVWQRKLNSLIRRNQGRIDAILAQAGVPLLNQMGTALLEPGQ